MHLLKRLILTLAWLAEFALAIWPLPTHYSNGSNVVWIDRECRMQYTGPAASNPHGRQPHESVVWTEKIVRNAAARTYDTLFNKNFYPWMFHQRMSDFEPSRTDGSTCIKSIILRQTSFDPSDIVRPALGSVDESYELRMSVDGRVSITAVSSLGLLHGLTTFSQLFFRHSSAGVYSPLAPVHISDSPKFGWRGLNVDTSRTFKPMSDMYRMVDSMSYNKMNRLHWHVTDAQAWPLEVPALPDLANKGAYNHLQKYSPEDVRRLQMYGALLGVQIVLEIDQPGHLASVWHGYPHLIAAFNAQPNWGEYCAQPPCGSLRLNDSAVPKFLETLFDDLLPRLKPLTQYFHLGGDEVNLNTYTLDPSVQSNDPGVLQPLLQCFMDRNQEQLTKVGFTPVVWEEQLLQWNLTMPRETIVQTWKSDQAVFDVVSKGHRALVGNYEYWYLDCGQGQWIDFHPESSADRWPYRDYCSPRKNWRLMYSLDPLAGIPEELSHLVVGGEAHIWSEQTDTVNLDRMVWPRACAAAEVLWSGAKDAGGRNRSQITASPRLSEMRERLVARGVGAEPIQMPFCTMGGIQCAL